MVSISLCVACSATEAEADVLSCAHDGFGTFELTHVEPSEHDENLEPGTWQCSRGAWTSSLTKWVLWESDSGELTFRLQLHTRDEELGPKRFARYSSTPNEGEVRLSIESRYGSYQRRYSTREESSGGTLELTSNGTGPGETIEGWFSDVRLAGSCSWREDTPWPDDCRATSIHVSGQFAAASD